MAGMPNKIIINHGGGRGMHSLIESDLEVLEMLGAEILKEAEKGSFALRDFNDLRDQMKVLCDNHYASDMAYHNGLRQLIVETAKRIDAKVSP